MFSCKVLSTAAAFVLYILWCKSPMPSHVRTLCRTSMVWRAAKCHCQAAEFMLHMLRIARFIFLLNQNGITIYFKNKFQALNTLLKSAEYTITRKRVFLFPCLKSCLDTATGGLCVCNYHEPSCGVQSSWKGKLFLFLLSTLRNLRNQGSSNKKNLFFGSVPKSHTQMGSLM